MVQSEEEYVLLASEAEETGTHEGTHCQVEGNLRLLSDPPPDFTFPLILRPHGEVGRRQRHFQTGRDHLIRPAVPVHNCRAQRLVSRHDCLERSLQSQPVEGTAEADGERHVIDRTAGLQTMKEPEPSLGE